MCVCESECVCVSVRESVCVCVCVRESVKTTITINLIQLNSCFTVAYWIVGKDLTFLLHFNEYAN